MNDTHAPRQAVRHFGVLLGTSLAMLVIKAHVMLPLMVRGVVGQGLYRRLNVVQFPETAIFTFLVVWQVAARLLHWPRGRALCAGVAAALLNFGLMVLDARWQSYNEPIEQVIAQRWGSPGTLLGVGAALAAAGALVLAALCWRKGGS